MYCNQCGAQLPDTAEFCNHCGALLAQKNRRAPIAAKSLLVMVIVVILLVLIVVFFVSKNKNEDAISSVSKEMYNDEIASGSDTIVPDSSMTVGDEMTEGYAGMEQTENMQEYPELLENEPIYGTWTDSDGSIFFTFSENGTIRIGGLSDILGVELFTFTVEDDNTLLLKADLDNPFLNTVSFKLSYAILGDFMAVEIAGITYKLIKQK